MKRPPSAFAAFPVATCPAGSGVAAKSRLALYCASGSARRAMSGALLRRRAARRSLARRGFRPCRRRRLAPVNRRLERRHQVDDVRSLARGGGLLDILQHLAALRLGLL